MINIRRGTFETNSSSTHSICVTRSDEKCEIPERLEINISDFEFGWEYEDYGTTEEKFAYLVMGIISGYEDNFLKVSQKLEKLIKIIGQWVKCVKIYGLNVECYDGKMYYETDGYVDHANEMYELIDALLNDEEMLKRYLFSYESFILTGNDNTDGYQNISVKYEHDEFFKGN